MMWLMLCKLPPKVAVTVFELLKAILQVEFPVQAPDQPTKESLFPGDAVNLTLVFGAKRAAQVVGQLIPLGLLVMVPVPPPSSSTVNPVPALKIAETLAAAVSVNTQALVPVQPPWQPPKK